MAHTRLEELFRLPSRELKALSFVKTDKASLAAWLTQLPTADMAKSTRLLYLATQEICQLNVSAATRLELNNTINPNIHHALNALKHHYLNQSIVLSDAARKIALLSHSLQMHLARSYLICACQADEKMGNLIRKPSQIMASAIFATLFEYSQILIRHYQLYQSPNEGFWKTVHSLYQLAVKYKLTQSQHNHPVLDGSYSIEQAYLSLLLWGSVRANQLRQDDIEKLQPFIWQWTSKVQLCPIESQVETSFIVDSHSDLPPMYLKYFQGKISASCFSLDTLALLAFLQENNTSLLAKKVGLSHNLLNHLILAWGMLTDRTFMRIESDSQLNLCVGLSTAHYFLRNQTPFKQFVFGDNEEAGYKPGASSAEFKAQPHQAEKLDVWESSLYGQELRPEAQLTMESIDYHIRSGGNSRMTFTGSDKEKYQHFSANIVNLSPTGYCLEWNTQNPVSIRAGEIIAVQENHQNQWHVGVIRWVRKNPNSGLQIGIELLSPSAEPFAARLADYTGTAQSDFIRAIVLPEVKTLQQEQSILLPNLSFKPNQLLLLIRGGTQYCIELNKVLSSSASYTQYTYQMAMLQAQKADSSNSGNPQDNDFDKVWDLL